MCGIAGYFGKKNISEQIIKNTLGNYEKSWARFFKLSSI